MANRSDDFNRTGASLGTPSDGGSAWVAVVGTWATGFDAGVGQTVAYGNALTSDPSNAYLECSVTDHAGQARLWTRSTVALGLTARFVDNSNYYLIYSTSGGALTLYKRVSGSYTSLASGGTMSDGDTMYIEAIGSAIATKKNGSPNLSASDSSLTTGTKCGLMGALNFPYFDDFAITDLSGGGATTRGRPFGQRGNAFNGGRTLQGIIHA